MPEYESFFTRNKEKIIKIAFYTLICSLTFAGVISIFDRSNRQLIFEFAAPSFPWDQYLIMLLLHSIAFYQILQISVYQFKCSFGLSIVLYFFGGLMGAAFVFVTTILPPSISGSYSIRNGYLYQLVFVAVYYTAFTVLLVVENIVHSYLKLAADSDAEETGRQTTTDDGPEAVKEEGKKNGKKAVMAGLIFSFGILFMIVLLKYGMEGILRNYGLYYRTWIHKLIRFIGLLILPFLPGIYLVLYIWPGEAAKGQPGLYILRKIGALFVAVLWFPGIIMISIFQSGHYEKEFRVGRMLGTEFGIEGPSMITYYDKAGIFLKRECSDKELIIRTVMEDKYQERFTVLEIEDEIGGYVSAVGSFESRPDLKVHISDSRIVGRVKGRYEDDRTQQTAYSHIIEFCREHGNDRKIVPEYEQGLMIEILIYCTYEEWEDCAEEAAQMIDYILEDAYFQQKGHTGNVTVVCGQEKNSHNSQILSFGTGLYDKQVFRNYADSQNVYDALYEVFHDNIYARDPETPEENGMSQMTEETAVQSPEGTGEAAAVGEYTTPEGAFRRLYEVKFAAGETGYEECYNAKGNFYAFLGNGREELSGVMRDTRHTVVYDRESKNGKCQLFVEYKDYLDDMDGGTYVYATEMIEFYAVNMATGEVEAAGKTSWEQVGSRKYREMTGE